MAFNVSLDRVVFPSPGQSYSEPLQVIEGLHRENSQGLTLPLKVKYHDFQSVTRSVTFPEPISDVETVMDHLKRLLSNTEAGDNKVRLLGVSVSNFLGAREETEGWVQLPIPFAGEEF